MSILIDSLLLLISIASTYFYLRFIKRKYGVQSSISASAKLVKVDGRSPLFYLFTIGLVVPMTYLSGNYLSVFAGMMLLGIGMITGYNPELKKNKTQDVIHIVLTDTAIVLFLAGIILMNYYFAIIVIIFAIPSLSAYIKKIKNHTLKIEIYIICIVYICLGIYRIVLPLLD